MKNKFNIRGEVTAVFISYQGNLIECLIDTKSLEILHDFEGTFRGVWNNTSKSVYVLGYDLSYVPKKNTMMHRYLLQAPDDLVVDHISHNTLDNRLKNIRLYTQSDNMLNKDPSKGNYKKITGIIWDKQKNKWRARYKRKDIDNHLGFFKEYNDAKNAMEKHILELKNK